MEALLKAYAKSSPRAWGCFSQGRYVDTCVPVFPTCVGVFLTGGNHECIHRGLPHVRGGVSLRVVTPEVSMGSSPRAWGCFSFDGSACKDLLVFPTCVGVFLSVTSCSRKRRSLPHVRGGVSPNRVHAPVWQRSSPRAWGCFVSHKPAGKASHVFPTCVGVFPMGCPATSPCGRLPHVRGGVSICPYFSGGPSTSSPRAWGCFSRLSRTSVRKGVFPTCVGVFRDP